MYGWSVPTVAYLFSNYGPVPKATGTEERAYTVTLSCYRSHVPQQLPVGASALELCSANSQCIIKSCLLEKLRMFSSSIILQYQQEGP